MTAKIVLAHPHPCGTFDCKSLNELPHKPCGRRPICCVRSPNQQYDSDRVLARGEVGKVGCRSAISVICAHCLIKFRWSRQYHDDQCNCPVVAGAHIASRGTGCRHLGTRHVQNDIIKEYLSRGTYICPNPLEAHRRCAEYCYTSAWEPYEVVYHLKRQARPSKSLFAPATATAAL